MCCDDGILRGAFVYWAAVHKDVFVELPLKSPSGMMNVVCISNIY